MNNQFRRGVVTWFDSRRGLGRMGDITFDLGEARRPQIVNHRMFYGPVGDVELPDPKKGDILIYEAHPEFAHEVRFWGYQREFFWEIQEFERAEQEHRDLVDEIHAQEVADIETDLARQYDDPWIGLAYKGPCDDCGHSVLYHDGCECRLCDCGHEIGLLDLLDDEPHQVQFTEGPMGHNGYE